MSIYRAIRSAITGLIVVFLLVASGEPVLGQDNGQKLLKDTNGEELKEVIDSFKGEKAVLVNVWATWCGPCKEEFPHIVELQKKYRDRLQVVFVSTDLEREAAIEFLREHGVDWTTYFNTEKKQSSFIEAVSDDWTGAMPFTKILNKQGEVVARWENSADFDKFEKNIKKAIN